ncbi:MAG: DNA polymerase I, partial [Planctomycetes bacterium]|nr:DNA polymerase I [Planctomycetota bacterium]
MSKSLYIIDGHGLIFAAFYAPIGGNLNAPSGEPTKATYIFTTMLLKLLREREPDMVAVAMDSPGPCFRHEMYSEYKANRAEMPEDLVPQIGRITEILEAMNITVLQKGGYEADDIIGTVVEQADAGEVKVYI